MSSPPGLCGAWAVDRQHREYLIGVTTSVDHVLPRNSGGEHVWDNVMVSCHRCNHVKADRHLLEPGWRLRHKPAPPTGLAWRITRHRAPGTGALGTGNPGIGTPGTGHWDRRRLPYLQPYGADDAQARIDGISA